MINDPIEMMRITNECLCFHCMKSIDSNNQYYEITLKSNISSTSDCSSYLSSNFPKLHIYGHGSILRFHISCFSLISGDIYLFDQNIYK